MPQCPRISLFDDTEHRIRALGLTRIGPVVSNGAIQSKDIAMTRFILWFAALLALPAFAQDVKIESRFAAVTAISMHYLFAGKGNPLILRHAVPRNDHTGS